MPSVYVDIIGKCSILAGGATPPNNTAPLADPYPATGRPLPAAAAAAAYAQACATSPPASPASATSATSAASAPNRAAAPGASRYREAAPACAPAYREASAPASAGVSCRATTASAAVDCASAAPTAAAAVHCKSYALAELGFVFLVEDIKRPQADVSDFLFTENNFRTRCGLLQRYIRCRCSCVCAACHRQGHSGGPQHR